MLYHVFSEGENVLFRNDTDYVNFNNKLAIAAYAKKISLLSETIMSSHFHCVAECRSESQIVDFIKELCGQHAYSYHRKYGFGIAGRVNVSYPVRQAYYDTSVRVCDLTSRRRRSAVGLAEVEENWMVDKNDMILPSSYVDIKRAEAIWNGNVRNFMYDINRNTLDGTRKVIDKDVQYMRTFGLSDTQICSVVDMFCAEQGLKSFHFLNGRQQEQLLHKLSKTAATPSQIKRCLWLD